MTDAEDLTEVAEDNARNIANAVRGDPSDWDPPGVHDLGIDKQLAMYGMERDHAAAQNAVNSLREQITPLAVKVLAFDFDSTDGSAWAVIGYSPGKRINNDDAMRARLKEEVEKTHRAVSKPE